MCGRYTLTIDQEALQAALGVAVLLEDHPRPRFNIAPTQHAPVLVRDGAPLCRGMRWGLVPSWAEDPAIGSRMINARSETVASKPSFRVPFRTRRCLVPADGFYEWSTGCWGPPPADDAPSGSPKTPWLIRGPEARPFTMAGIWDRWVPPGGGASVDTFSILTADAEGPMAGLHHRMPVVVVDALREAWLSDPEPGPVLEQVLQASGSASSSFTAHTVSTRVNKPENDGPELVQPLGEDPPAPQQPSLFD
jgi:putative SOS response-associated peptidase YedK